MYRKVFPAQHRSAYTPGGELPVFAHNDATFGIVICNDSNYVEPARVMAKAGASILFVPMNNALPLDIADRWRARARTTLVARAVENAMSVVGADIAGRDDERVSYGATAIYNQDGKHWCRRTDCNHESTAASRKRVGITLPWNTPVRVRPIDATSRCAQQLTQTVASGTARNLSDAICSLHRSHLPNVPSRRRRSASSRANSRRCA